MASTVRIPDPFQKDLKRLAQKFPKVLDTVDALIRDLKLDERPGDQISGVGYPVYKVRLANLSANRGKRRLQSDLLRSIGG